MIDVTPRKRAVGLASRSLDLRPWRLLLLLDMSRDTFTIRHTLRDIFDTGIGHTAIRTLIRDNHCTIRRCPDERPLLHSFATTVS